MFGETRADYTVVQLGKDIVYKYADTRIYPFPALSGLFNFFCKDKILWVNRTPQKSPPPPPTPLNTVRKYDQSWANAKNITII